MSSINHNFAIYYHPLFDQKDYQSSALYRLHLNVDDVILLKLQKKLSSTLKLSILPKAVVTTVKYEASKDKQVTKDKELQSHMEEFLRSIKVVTCRNLKLVILLKETTTAIGQVKVSFFSREK